MVSHMPLVLLHSAHSSSWGPICMPRAVEQRGGSSGRRCACCRAVCGKMALQVRLYYKRGGCMHDPVLSSWMKLLSTPRQPQPSCHRVRSPAAADPLASR